jgi:hypothetical protein
VIQKERNTLWREGRPGAGWEKLVICVLYKELLDLRSLTPIPTHSHSLTFPAFSLLCMHIKLEAERWGGETEREESLKKYSRVTTKIQYISPFKQKSRITFHTIKRKL